VSSGAKVIKSAAKTLNTQTIQPIVQAAKDAVSDPVEALKDAADVAAAFPVAGAAAGVLKEAETGIEAAEEVVEVVGNLANQNTLYKAAVDAFKNTSLTNARRALTKHPEIVGESRETLRQVLRTDEQINDAAHSALRDIMRNGETTYPTLGRYGTVTQIRNADGFGARWAEDQSFIGFISP